MRRGRLRVAGALLAGVLALPGCASVAEHRKLERKVHELAGGDVGQQTREQLADLTAEVDRLAAEVDALRGDLEVAEHRAEEALAEARAARRTAAGSAASRSGGGAGTEGPGAPVALLPELEPDPAEPAPADPARSEGSGDEQDREPPDPAEGDLVIEGSPGAVPAGRSAEEMARYREAFGAWRRGELQTCVEDFREFLQNFESSPYADDALYWMADCYTRQGDLEKAILRFDDVVKRYPEGNKAPDALFRQGEVLLELGPAYQQAARDVFERVVSEYPDSPRADEARRQLELLGASETSRRAPAWSGA